MKLFVLILCLICAVSVQADTENIHFICQLKKDPSFGILVSTNAEEFQIERRVNIYATVRIFKDGKTLNKLTTGIIGMHEPIAIRRDQIQPVWGLGATLARGSISMGYGERKQTWYLYVMTPEMIIRDEANCAYSDKEAYFPGLAWE